MKPNSELKILLVDDHAILRKGLKRILEDHSYSTIFEAENAIEALTIVRRHHPEILIIDISLPGMRGIELAYEIYKIFQDTKIIFLTIHKEAEYITQALAAGASGYVLKDCLDTEIIIAIQCVSQGKTYITPMISDEIRKVYLKSSELSNNQSPLESLSTREREVITLICEGRSNKGIAEFLNISSRTVEHHRNNAMKKLGVGSIAELVKICIKQKFIEL